MKFRDYSAWENFVYNLLYPGILGSMIYDVSQLFRGTLPLDWFYITQILIVILYVTDYLHMYSDLRPQLKCSRHRLIIDALIPILFAVVYWSMTREDFLRVFLILPLIMFLILIYPCPENWKRKIFTLGKTILFVLSLIILGLSASKRFVGGSYAAYSLGAVLIGYWVHVFFFTEKARKPM